MPPKQVFQSEDVEVKAVLFSLAESTQHETDVGRQTEGVRRRDNHLAARIQEMVQSVQHGAWIRQMLDEVPDNDGVERLFGKDGALVEFLDVAYVKSGFSLSDEALNYFRSQINTYHLFGSFSEFRVERPPKAGKPRSVVLVSRSQEPEMKYTLTGHPLDDPGLSFDIFHLGNFISMSHAGNLENPRGIF